MTKTADAPVLAYVVNPDGTGGMMDTDFAGIQKLVEGYVEVIVGSLGGETVIACVNEDGLMAGKPVNNPASAIVQEMHSPHILVGTVVFVGDDGDEFAWPFGDIPQAAIEEITTILEGKSK